MILIGFSALLVLGATGSMHGPQPPLAWTPKYMFVDSYIFVDYGTHLWIVIRLQLFKSNKNFHRYVSVISSVQVMCSEGKTEHTIESIAGLTSWQRRDKNEL